MNLFLAIFEKEKNSLCHHNALDCFAIKGKRIYEDRSLPQGMLYFFDQEKQRESFFENDELFLCYSGEIYGISNSIVKIADVGNMLLNYFGNYTFDKKPEISGEFSLFIYHKATKIYYFINDTFGFYPLYYFSSSDFSVFCNEIEPIIAYHSNNCSIDKQSLIEYFCLGHTIGNRTFYEGISILECGKYIKFSPDFKTQINFYDSSPCLSPSKDINAIADQFAFLLKEAVNKRIDTDRNETFTLTAGIDTRIILQSIDKDILEKQRFLTYKIPKLAPEMDQDVMISKQISTLLKLHLTIKDYLFFENEMDSSYYKNIRDYDQEIFFSGVFASEIIRGEIRNAINPLYYNFIRNIRKKTKLSFLQYLNAKRNLNKYLNSFRYLFSEDYKPYISEITANIESEFSKGFHYRNAEIYYMMAMVTRSFYQNIYGGTRSFLMEKPGQIFVLLKTPFLDNQLLEFIMGLSYNYYQKNIVEIYNRMFTKYFSELMHIPTNSSFTSRKGFVLSKLNTGINPLVERSYKYDNMSQFIKENKESRLNHVFNSPVSEILETNPLGLRQKIVDFELWSKHLNEL